MIKPLENEFLTTSELLERGWTKTLIGRFLPRPDRVLPVIHWKIYRGKDVYSAIKIWNSEQSCDFEVAFMRSWKGRMKDRSPETLLAEIRVQPHPKIPARDRSQILLETAIAEAAGHLLLSGVEKGPR